MGVIVSNVGYFTSFHMPDSRKPLSILTGDDLSSRISFSTRVIMKKRVTSQDKAAVDSNTSDRFGAVQEHSDD